MNIKKIMEKDLVISNSAAALNLLNNNYKTSKIINTNEECSF